MFVEEVGKEWTSNAIPWKGEDQQTCKLHVRTMLVYHMRLASQEKVTWSAYDAFRKPALFHSGSKCASASWVKELCTQWWTNVESFSGAGHRERDNKDGEKQLERQRHFLFA